MKRNQLFALITSLLLSSAAAHAGTAAQSTSFTYQGQLNAGGTFPGGQTYQFTFTLYDESTGGNVIGTPVQQALPIAAAGLFTTDLDFGQVFNGTQFWLEIKVGSTVGSEETLAERQPINAVPVAQWALNSPAGAMGPQGPQGVAGPQGASGADGAQGPIGPQGLAGVDGAQGAPGAQGPTGATGLNWQGPWGSTAGYNPDDAVSFGGSSYIALKANTGDEPDTSVGSSDGNWALLAQQGATGAQGGQGIQGPQGSAGNNGVDGQQGPQGPAGAQGAQGLAGTNGVDGAQGSAGAQGATGATGVNWQGAWGATAAYNPDDAVFFAGSSYIALLANSGDEPDTSVSGNDGNWALLAQQGLTGSQGPQGLIGTPGVQGAPGLPGPPGDLGLQGPQGAAGANGAQGPQGAQGIAGTQGAQGAQGAAGSVSANVRVGTVSPGAVTSFTTPAFAALANNSYSVALTLQGATGTISAGFGRSGCLYNITARTTTTFTFECRAIDANSALNLNGLTFEYIVIHP